MSYDESITREDVSALAGSRSTPKNADDDAQQKSETPAVEPNEEHQKALDQGYVGEAPEADDEKSE